MAGSWEKGQFLHRTDTAILPALAFLFSSHTSHCPLASSFANIQEDASLKLIPISCLSSHVPFTSKLSEQAVRLHYLELLQLFWIFCSWLSFLCSARSALITKSCLLAKSQSQSFFSSSLTLQLFFFFFGKYNTVLLSIFLYPCLPPCLFCLHCYSLLYYPFGVHSLSLSQPSVHSALTSSSNNQHFRKCRTKNICSLTLCMCNLLPYYLANMCKPHGM